MKEIAKLDLRNVIVCMDFEHDFNHTRWNVELPIPRVPKAVL